MLPQNVITIFIAIRQLAFGKEEASPLSKSHSHIGPEKKRLKKKRRCTSIAYSLVLIRKIG